MPDLCFAGKRYSDAPAAMLRSLTSEPLIATVEIWVQNRMQIAAVAAAWATFALPAMAFDAPPGIKTGETAIGTVLTDAAGHTLYTFDEDSAGKSACYGRCAETWPPVKVPHGAAAVGGFTVVNRDDGSAQWAYKDKPLYLWVRDKAPGETTGDGVRGWHAARP